MTITLSAKALVITISFLIVFVAVCIQGIRSCFLEGGSDAGCLLSILASVAVIVSLCAIFMMP
jgi:hypothetical protein